MKSSCIRHPENNRYIQLHEWQIHFCKGSHCAALILSYFIAWHDWKLRNDQYYRRSNDIAEIHGDGRPHNEDAYLFFSTEQLVDGCMGLYGKKAITDGLELLVSLGVISVHKNPNPRYHFDKTKYFKFYPKICNRWIAENYPIGCDNEEDHAQLVDSYDSAKIPNRKNENALPVRKNDRPSGESGQAITDTTNNTTNKKQSINLRDDNFGIEDQASIYNQQIKPIADLLVEKGMTVDRFKAKDDLMLLINLVEQGATVAMVAQAYDASVKATGSRGGQFGVRYLAKAVESLLIQQKTPRQLEKVDECTYTNDLKNAQSWAGDLI